MKSGVTRHWFVASGPDSRHLIDVSAHNKLSEARAAYATAPGRAKQLFSLDFMPWQNGYNKRVLKEVLH
jgi:hypothetical protein